MVRKITNTQSKRVELKSIMFPRIKTRNFSLRFSVGWKLVSCVFVCIAECMLFDCVNGCEHMSERKSNLLWCDAWCVSIIYSQFPTISIHIKKQWFIHNCWFSSIHLNCNFRSAVHSCTPFFVVPSFGKTVKQKKNNITTWLNWGEMKEWFAEKHSHGIRNGKKTVSHIAFVAIVMKYVVICLMKY